METTIVYGGYIGIMENDMEAGFRAWCVFQQVLPRCGRFSRDTLVERIFRPPLSPRSASKSSGNPGDP